MPSACCLAETPLQCRSRSEQLWCPMVRTFEAVRKAPSPPKVNRFIDLNTDFGQTADRAFFEGKERTLLHFVSSVNIPCGVHDSDPARILKDIQTAKQNNCAVGAH